MTAQPGVSAAEFAALVRRAGLTLDEAELASLHAVHGRFEAMIARLRGAGVRARGSEPAHVFVPGEGW